MGTHSPGGAPLSSHTPPTGYCTHQWVIVSCRPRVCVLSHTLPGNGPSPHRCGAPACARIPPPPPRGYHPRLARLHSLPRPSTHPPPPPPLLPATLSLRPLVRAFAAEAAPASASAPTELTLNFAAPARSIVAKKAVVRVTVPGRGGALGVEKNTPTILTELAPGIVTVNHTDNSVEKVFIPGGFAFKHANNNMDVSTPEAVKLDMVDADALRSAAASEAKKRDGALPGSKEHVEASLCLDVYKSLSQSMGVAL